MCAPPHRTIILGGGLSGLSSAYYIIQNELARKSSEHNLFPLILEATNRVGGLIQSHKLDNGTIFEQGPHTIRPRGQAGENTLRLIEDLGLESDIVSVSRDHEAARNRMIYAKGQLHKLPSSFGSLFIKQAPFSKPLISLLSKDLYTKRKTIRENDESTYDFINRRFGSEVADYLISPLIGGICAGNAKEISVKFLMESLFDKEQKYGTISNGLIIDLLKFKQNKSSFPQCRLYRTSVKERWGLYSFNNGIETLVHSLENKIKSSGAEIKCNINCRNISFDKNIAKIDIGSEILETKNLISSIPAVQLSKLIKSEHPELSNILNQIKPVSVGVVNLEYSGKLLKDIGFGFLVPPKENLPILGVIYDSCSFPRGHQTVFTVLMGGYWFNDQFGENPNSNLFYETAVQQIANILGIREIPSAFRVSILKEAIPQYTVGHKKRLDEIDTYIKNTEIPLSLCGASYHGVGVNDVIVNAKDVVNRLYLA